MNRPHEPSFDQRIADWLEEDPNAAPRDVLRTVLAAYPSIPQRRDFGITWRPRTMFDRIAVAAVAAVVAIGTLSLGASLLTTRDSAAGPCPATLDEADAVDLTVPGLTQAQRGWGISGGGSEGVRPGRIAGFAHDAAARQTSLVAVEPASGERCVLIRIPARYPIQAPNATSLDWSPSGDALAIGLGNAESQTGDLEGEVLLWTPGRVLRLWSGGGTPYLDWAPDGQSIAIWNQYGPPEDLRIVHADGSPDRTVGIHPHLDGLHWSPDGSRWIVTKADESVPPPLVRTTISVVEVGSGRETPLDIDGQLVDAAGWIDPSRILVVDSAYNVGVTRLLEVVVDGSQVPSVLPIADLPTSPYVALSPDGGRVAYLADGALVIAGVTEGSPALVRVDPSVEVAGIALAWSPDGGQLLFQTETPVGDGVTFALWTVAADGSQARRIVDSIVAADDPWQPLAAAPGR